MSDPLKPDAQLLMKLGSIVVHADEATSPGSSSLDVDAIRSLVADPAVQAWVKDMGALLPVKRSA